MAAEDREGEPAPRRDPGPACDGGPRDGRPLREIAVEMYGADPGSESGAGRVDAEWHPDGWMRATVRRRLRRSRLLARRPPAPAPGPDGEAGGQAGGQGGGRAGDGGTEAAEADRGDPGSVGAGRNPGGNTE